MSFWATITLSWVGVYAFLCLFYCALYARRREGLEYLMFGLFAGFMSVYTMGAAMLTDGANYELGRRAQDLQFGSAISAIPFYLHFMYAYVHGRAPKWIWAAYVVGLSSLGVALAGLAFLDGVHAPPKTSGFAGAPLYPESEMSPLGASFVLFWMGVLLFCIGNFWKHRKIDKDARLLAIGGAAVVFAAAHDQVILSSSFRSVYLLEHAGMIANMTVGWVLLGRFTRTTDELSRRSKELQRSYTYLRHTQEALIEKEQLATVGELSAVIAHEVRNPIAIIKNAAATLKNPSLADTDRGGLLSILDDETDRLNRIVNNLLAFARPVVPRSRPTEIAPLLHHALELAREVRSFSNITVREEIDQDSKPIDVDPDLVRQVFMNIIDNAVQAMPQGGILTVKNEIVRRDGGDTMQIVFQDTGEGMDPLVRDRSRDPFFTTRPSGTGLGLAIVQRVVTAHAGQVDIASSHGKGTTVTLTLPCDRHSSNPPVFKRSTFQAA